jgi:hypothetical protein
MRNGRDLDNPALSFRFRTIFKYIQYCVFFFLMVRPSFSSVRIKMRGEYRPGASFLVGYSASILTWLAGQLYNRGWRFLWKSSFSEACRVVALGTSIVWLQLSGSRHTLAVQGSSKLFKKLQIAHAKQCYHSLWFDSLSSLQSARSNPPSQKGPAQLSINPTPHLFIATVPRRSQHHFLPLVSHRRIHRWG